MKRNQDNDTYAVMYRPSREPFDTYPTEHAARRAMQTGEYKTSSDASPENICLAVWDSIRGWIEHKPTTDDQHRDDEPSAEMKAFFQALTPDEAAAANERQAAQERRREQREEIERRAAAPIQGRSAGAIIQGVLFAMDESLFSGRSQERRVAC